MSTVTPNTDTIPVKNRKVLKLRNREPFAPQEIAWACDEGLHRLPTRYTLDSDPRRESFTTPDGNMFRRAGELYIRVCRDGVRRFVAYVHPDSVDHDFIYLDEIINNAKHGRMAGWVQHTFKDGSEGWAFDYPNYQISERLQQSFKHAAVIIEELTDVPGLVGFGTSWGYACTEPRCREKFHENEDANHILEVLEDTINERGSYEIEICKDITKPDSRWYLNVWVNGDTTELNHEQVAKLANDLTWMALECQTTNAKEGRK